MNLTIPRRALHAGLQSVTRAASGRSSLPVLSNVLIGTCGDEIIALRATDLELCIHQVLSARIGESGAVTLPAKTLSEIVAALPDGDVTLSTDAQHAGTLFCGRSRYRIQGLPAIEYPPAPEVKDAFRFEVPHAVLRNLIRHVLPSIAADETRPILTGALLELTPDGVVLVSTDTHRLAVAKASLAHAGCEAQRTLPGRLLREVLRLLDPKSDAQAVVDLGENEVRFTASAVTVTGRLLEGTFPKYQQVLPTAYTRHALIEAEPLARAVKRAAVVARDNANRVTLTFADNDLAIAAAAGDTGECREELSVVEHRPESEFSIAFNATYLAEALEACGAEAVRLEMTEPMAPAVLRAVGDDSVTMVIMPMEQGPMRQT